MERGIDFVLTIILLCVAGFVAAFVDSIAGGGGLISLPAFLAAGIPPHLSLGTNKLASTTASCTSSIKYVQSDKANPEVLKYLIPCTLLGAALGVNAVLSIEQKYLYAMVLFLILGVGLYSIFSKSIGQTDRYQGINKWKITFGILLAFILGFYDGFFGPGTGSFLLFGLVKIFGFDFVRAGGNARVLNFVSNITALVLFAIHRQINYYYGLPVAVAMFFGARLGTKLALTRGVKVVKPIFITMSLAVAVKMLLNLLKIS